MVTNIMLASAFPDPGSHDFPQWVLTGEYFYDGRDIVSIGNALTLANLREAYSKGIFPWNFVGMPLPWYCPQRRAILDFAELKIPRSLAKVRRSSRFTFSIDRDFRSVIENCSRVFRPDQPGTWITAEFVERYTELHHAGMAHSVEVWDGEGLVGGLYGVDAGGLFCGESMFHLAPNASKLALLFLIDRLRERGSDWIDVQVMTPHMEALGAKEIKRTDFFGEAEPNARKTTHAFLTGCECDRALNSPESKHTDSCLFRVCL